MSSQPIIMAVWQCSRRHHLPCAPRNKALVRVTLRPIEPSTSRGWRPGRDLSGKDRTLTCDSWTSPSWGYCFLLPTPRRSMGGCLAPSIIRLNDGDLYILSFSHWKNTIDTCYTTIASAAPLRRLFSTKFFRFPVRTKFLTTTFSWPTHYCICSHLLWMIIDRNGILQARKSLGAWSPDRLQNTAAGPSQIVILHSLLFAVRNGTCSAKQQRVSPALSTYHTFTKFASTRCLSCRISVNRLRLHYDESPHGCCTLPYCLFPYAISASWQFRSNSSAGGILFFSCSILLY